MEIHTPDKPISSLREFAVHIGIVTIGILIALGLEGLREMLHERHQLHETKALIRQEAEENRRQMEHEAKVVAADLEKIDVILKNYDSLAHAPTQLQAKVAELQPAGYFFSAISWESALSTGVIRAMSVDEVDRDASFAYIVHSYNSMQTQEVQKFFELQAFFRSHAVLDERGAMDGREKLELFKLQLSALRNMSRAMGRLHKAAAEE